MSNASDLIDKTVNTLNEAAALDPNIFSLFDCMVPCAPVVGHATNIELMSVTPSLARVGTLGIINGMLEDSGSRICIIVEEFNGKAKRTFARTTIAPNASGALVPGLSSGDSQG